nr:hypothetical protein [uncultured Cohaesibacter sp.]
MQQNLTSKEYELFAIGVEQGTQAMNRAVPNIGIMQAAELEAKMINVSRYADQICRQ